MKKVFLLLSFLSSTCFSQDMEMFDLINQYRKFYKKEALTLDSNLMKSSILHNGKMLKKDSLYHSKDEHYEVISMEAGCSFQSLFDYKDDMLIVKKGTETNKTITMSPKNPINNDLEESFVEFLKNKFNVIYEEPKNEKEFLTYCKMRILYIYENSEKHKSIILRKDLKTVGFDYKFFNIDPKGALFIFMNKQYRSSKKITDYSCDYYSIIQFE